jgi:hypothetical protein
MYAPAALVFATRRQVDGLGGQGIEALSRARMLTEY